MGASILYSLSARGVPGVLLERDTLGSGSTGRSSAAIRMHYITEVNARLAWESLKVFQNFDDVVGGGDPGFVNTGYMVIVPEDRFEGFRRNIAMLQSIGISTSIITRQEAQDLAPSFHLDDNEAFAWEPESGHADPSGAALAFTTRAREKGARVVLRSPARTVEIRNGCVTAVVTDTERYETPVAVVATGPWSPQFLGGLGIDLPLRVTRNQVILLRRSIDRVPSHPGAGDQSKLTYFRTEGKDLTLVGHGGYSDEEVEPEGFNPDATMDFANDIWQKLARRIPAMAEAELFTGYAGLYTSTPDYHSVIDKVDGIEGLYICTGFSGHGFKESPAAGIVMAELILDGEARTIDITPLRLNRFQEEDLNPTDYNFRATQNLD